jgi:hypothetical protein
MNGLEMCDAKGSLDGSCFGELWDISSVDCAKCFVRKLCEDKTKRGTAVQEDVPGSDEDVVMPEIPPMEYMIDLLKGRLDYKVQENDKAIAHYFRKDEKPVFTIIISKTNGKVKLQTATGQSKVVDKIESIEQVEGLIKEMVG